MLNVILKRIVENSRDVIMEETDMKVNMRLKNDGLIFKAQNLISQSTKVKIACYQKC